MILWNRIDQPFMWGTDLRLFFNTLSTCRCAGGEKGFIERKPKKFIRINIDGVKQNDFELNVNNIINSKKKFIIDRFEYKKEKPLGLMMTRHNWDDVIENDNLFKFSLIMNPVQLVYQKAFSLCMNKIGNISKILESIIDEMIDNNFDFYDFSDYTNTHKYNHVFVVENISEMINFFEKSLNITLNIKNKHVGVVPHKPTYRIKEIEKILWKYCEIYKEYEKKKYKTITKDLIFLKTNLEDYYQDEKSKFWYRNY